MRGAVLNRAADTSVWRRLVTLYAILGIRPDADNETIRTAYKALARRYHPDAGEGASSEKFREVVSAFETLSHPGRRRVYDCELGYVRRVEIPIEPMVGRTFSAGVSPYMDEIFEDMVRWFEHDWFDFGSAARGCRPGVCATYDEIFEDMVRWLGHDWFRFR